MTGKCAAKILFSYQSPQYASKNIDLKQRINGLPSPSGYSLAFPDAGPFLPDWYYNCKKEWSK
jgi:hypothetical protein